jgi:3D (Asp-Asp-Asp) domain-containing protein
MRFICKQGSIRLPKVGLFSVAVLLALAIQMFVTPVVVSGSSGPTVKVVVAADGSQWEWVSGESTVGGILNEAGITLGVKDRVSPSLATKAHPGMKITVSRIEERIVIQSEPVKFKTVIKYDAASSARRIIQEGKNGEKQVKYLVTLKDGIKVAGKPLSSWMVSKPVDQVVAISHPTQLASRGGQPYRKFTMVATAYAPFVCGGSRSGHTCTGVMAGKGIIAVDPRVIPLGTQMYVEGYGFCVAGDTGGDIKGGRLDLGFDTYSQAIAYGRKTVTVYVMD